ncbi:MAG TPA: hypothetical protein PLR20_00800 [Syntrophales bacterium]|nr:hypothetical protein [Syntrophales bacterium]HPI55911.1 hypothetical protein [Syntrophales bacterium]HPN23598.1 hypothetical protein [Syntrophales bacterium]HQM27877.1 hypothetical protein [Syntrophales bacterium]
MLLHTHTWILREFMQRHAGGLASPDILIYNVIPDILPIHESISSQMTHRVPRFRAAPAAFRKAAFVQFHLMVDDVAHYGTVTEKGADVFHSNPGGYAYEKGKTIVPRIMDFHARSGKPISADEAIYRSHMLIEMAFDLLLFEREGSLLDLFTEALADSLGRGRPEMVSTLQWLLDIPSKTIETAMDRGFAAYGGDRIRRTMSLDGRTRLYIEKFNYEPEDGRVRREVEDWVSLGMGLSEDYKSFLDHTLTVVRAAGFLPAL